MIPLSERVRPKAFGHLLGQEHVFSKGKPLWELVHKDALFAAIFYGPPGTGKTSLAKLIGGLCGRRFIALSAVSDGVKEIREAMALSIESLAKGHPAALLFIDEIHRLNKNQQDVLLPALEAGTVRFIGATTEHPSFAVNKALLSRSLTFAFHKLSSSALMTMLKGALAEVYTESCVSDDVLVMLCDQSFGDGRMALNLLESIILSYPVGHHLTLADALLVMPEHLRAYDKKGAFHYDLASALIKSIRASKPDAAIHYLARMIDGGEPPEFIGRRLVISASEDIGNANPTALLMAHAAMESVAKIGYPEARIILSQVVIYLAVSPKSNRSYLAINEALADCERLGPLDVPLHLRNPVTPMMQQEGYGAGYVYSHDDHKASHGQAFLPTLLKGKIYYQPSQNGSEKAISTHIIRD